MLSMLCFHGVLFYWTLSNRVANVIIPGKWQEPSATNLPFLALTILITSAKLPLELAGCQQKRQSINRKTTLYQHFWYLKNPSREA